MLSMKFCIEWCRAQGLLSLETSNFWGSVSWVSRVSPHIQILRSWDSKILRLSQFWGPGFSGSHCISKSWGPGFPGSCGITQFWGPGFPESHGKKDVQGPRSIKVPDLGLSEPRISNLFGTLAQVWYIHTHPPTWPKSDFHRLFDSGFAPSAISLRLNKAA